MGVYEDGGKGGKYGREIRKCEEREEREKRTRGKDERKGLEGRMGKKSWVDENRRKN